MMNYYWMEGPLSGDKGRRVLVLHNGQVSQCKRGLQGGCPAGGNEKACGLMVTTKEKMSVYMQSLRSSVGYVSLKTKYMEQHAKNFPALPGFDTDIVSSMEENEDQESEIVPISPMEEKDKQICDLKRKV